jgi:hypothetical protein
LEKNSRQKRSVTTATPDSKVSSLVNMRPSRGLIPSKSKIDASATAKSTRVIS